jgi:MFS family permease
MMRSVAQFKPWRSFINVLNEYPSQFWVLVVSGFVDRLGGTMLFPFFSIYIAQTFDVGLTAIGYVFLLAGLAGVGGGFIGGPITDRFGRKSSIIIGLMLSASASIGIGLSPVLPLMLVFMMIGSFFGEIGGPAQQAMIADIIPEEQRSEAFGIMRVVMNMAWIVGPLLGGIIALQSYLLLFITDAVTSTIMAVIVLTVVRESYHPDAQPQDGDDDKADERPQPGLMGTLRSYRPALKDNTFMVFAGLAMLVQFVYLQMYVTLPYWLVDVEGMSESDWSIILVSNALLVVLVQFPIMRRTRSIPPFLVLAGAAVLYAVGYAMFGIFAGLLMFVLAMVVITFGEMLFFPTAQAVAANLSPATMRGRYMAVYGLANSIPSMTNTLLAGVIIDNLNPDILWLGCGVLGLIVAGAYYAMRHFGATAGDTTPAAADPTPAEAADGGLPVAEASVAGD